MASAGDGATLPKRRRLVAGADDLGGLTDVVQATVLGYLAQAGGAAAAACRRLGTAWRRPAAWEGSRVELAQATLADDRHRRAALQLGEAAWGLAAEVALPPHPKRSEVEAALLKAHAELGVSVRVGGRVSWPLPLFVMRSGPVLGVGSRMALHFFEPRYCWMCRRITNQSDAHQPFFGFVSADGADGAAPGDEGYLCHLGAWGESPRGTFDTAVRSVARFTLLEVWCEHVPSAPSAPPLSVGYVQTDPDSELPAYFGPLE